MNLRNIKEANKIVQSWIEFNNPSSKLDLSYLKLTELPLIPSTCQKLYCHNNNLTFLPELPDCKLLFCNSNQLTYLPSLPNCQRLWCYDNLLTSLPSLPNCTYLSCFNNKLTCLPKLDKCIRLYCYNNKLTHLPELPNCSIVQCYNNELTILPNIPNCDQLRCYNNKLTSLPYLPRIYTGVQCHNNKYLYINKHQAKKLGLQATLNYNRYATVIQRAYKKYMRNKYYDIISQHLFKGPAKIVSLFAI